MHDFWRQKMYLWFWYTAKNAIYCNVGITHVFTASFYPPASLLKISVAILRLNWMYGWGLLISIIYLGFVKNLTRKCVNCQWKSRPKSWLNDAILDSDDLAADWSIDQSIVDRKSASSTDHTCMGFLTAIYTAQMINSTLYRHIFLMIFIFSKWQNKAIAHSPYAFTNASPKIVNLLWPYQQQPLNMLPELPKTTFFH